MGSIPAVHVSGSGFITEPLTDGDIEAIVLRLGFDFGWDPVWNEPITEHLWTNGRTGNSFARIKARHTSDRILLKWLGPRDGEATGLSAVTPTVAKYLDDLSSLFADRCPTVALAPRPLGWLEQPQVIAMEFIEGTELAEVAGQPDHEFWDTPEVISGWVGSAAEALATFHDHGPTGHAVEEAAIAVLSEKLRRYRLSAVRRKDLLDYAMGPRVVAPRYQDFGPGNLLGLQDGGIAVLDPPLELDLAPRHRDLAHFLFLIRRDLAGIDVDTRRTVGPERGMGIRRDFLASYEANSGFPVEDGRGKALLAMYESFEAFGVARRIAAGRDYLPRSWSRWQAAAWAARTSLASRVRAVRALQIER